MLKTLGIFLLLHSPIVSSESFLFNATRMQNFETDGKANHAYAVVSKIYSAFRQWFFTITFCDFTYFENRILKYTETMDYGYPVLLLDGCPNPNRTRSKPRINIHGQTAYVITAEALNLDGSEYVIEALLRTGLFKPRATVIFILNVPISIDGYFYYTMKSHFQLLWSRSITNSVVMLMWANKLWTYSYNIYLDEIQDVSDVKNIHHWLSNQYNNLYGHELRVGVFRKPYQLRDSEPVRCDSRLALAVLKRLNATCKPLRPRDGKTVGDLLSNGSATGVTADLIDGYTDLELNSRILKNSFYGYIDTTYPLTQDELCFMVKNHDKESTFSTIIQAISITILLIFMFNVVALIIIAILARELEIKMWNIKQKRTVGSTVMDLVKCFIRQTVDVRLPAFVYRCIVLMIIMYSLVVDCVIDGIITSSITYPRYRGPVNTMDELIRSNLTLGVYARHLRMFNRSLDDDTYTLIKNRIEIINDKKTLSVIDQRQFQYAILLKRADLEYIVSNITNRENGRPVFRIMPECPLPCSIVYGLRYGSPYLFKINDILYHLYQGGILQYWAKSEQLKGTKGILDPENKDLKPLTLGSLQELFEVWAIGLLISTLVFLFEILHNKRRTISCCVRRKNIDTLSNE